MIIGYIIIKIIQKIYRGKLMNRKSRIISVFLSVLMLLQCFGIITLAKTQNTNVLPAKAESYSPEAYAISEITSKRERNVKHSKAYEYSDFNESKNNL